MVELIGAAVWILAHVTWHVATEIHRRRRTH